MTLYRVRSVLNDDSRHFGHMSPTLNSESGLRGWVALGLRGARHEVVLLRGVAAGELEDALVPLEEVPGPATRFFEGGRVSQTLYGMPKTLFDST